jgi:hypothetical protein
MNRDAFSDYRFRSDLTERSSAAIGPILRGAADASIGVDHATRSDFRPTRHPRLWVKACTRVNSNRAIDDRIGTDLDIVINLSAWIDDRRDVDQCIDPFACCGP